MTREAVTLFACEEDGGAGPSRPSGGRRRGKARFVAVEDSFGESGTPAQLLEKYGLGPSAIAKACREAIAVKQGLPA